MRVMAMILAGAAGVGVSAAGARPEGLDRFMRFALYNGCRPVALTVNDSNDTLADSGIDLEAGDIENLAVERLRDAGLYADLDGVSPFVGMEVSIAGATHNVSLVLYKIMSDDASGVRAFGMSWMFQITGTHGDGPERILSDASKVMDRFLTDYRRENRNACD